MDEEWKPISDLPMKAGEWLVWAPNRKDGRKPYSAGRSNYSVLARTINNVGVKVDLVDCHFVFDMPTPEKFRSIPEMK